MLNKITKKKLREFGYLIGLGLPLIVGFILPFIFGHGFRWWTFWISLPFLISGVLFPNILKIPYQMWMQLGHILGWLNSRIILGLVYIIVLLPIAIIMKFFKYDPLRLKKLKVLSYKEYKKGSKSNLTRIF